jgi:hypothetical protein
MTLRSFFPADLSEDQENAVREIGAFLSDKVTNCFILRGYAGTGKTFLMEGLSRYLSQINRHFELMAPTGRAALVMAKRTGHEAATIHKAIYNLQHFEDKDESFQITFPLKENKLSADAVFIVDEASMISDERNLHEFFLFGSGFLLRDLIHFIAFPYRPGSKLILMGDDAQLPPPDQKQFSPALDEDYLGQNYSISIRSVTMREIRRQKSESGILVTASMLRAGLESGSYLQFSLPEKEDILRVNGEGFSNEYLRVTDAKVDKTCVVICHANQVALEYNQKIRPMLFQNPRILEAGDILMNTRNNYNYETDIYNGQFIRVLKPGEAEAPRKVRFKQKTGIIAEEVLRFANVDIEVENVAGNLFRLQCKVLLNILGNSEPSLTRSEQQALYVDFKQRHASLVPGSKEFKDALRTDRYFNALQIKYGYAITCHKSQGGEWEKVFVDMNASMKPASKGYFRWLYTAVTRARTCLFALNPKEINLEELISINPVETLNGPLPNSYLFVPSLDLYPGLKMVEPAFRIEKQKEIHEIFHLQEIEISFTELQYKDRYRFSKGNATVSVDMHYKKSGFTGMIDFSAANSDELKELVSGLLKKPPMAPVSFHPPHQARKDMFELLNVIAEEEGSRITNIAENQNCDRIFIKTEAETALFDCHFSASGSITTITPRSTLGKEDTMLGQMVEKLKINLGLV